MDCFAFWSVLLCNSNRMAIIIQLRRPLLVALSSRQKWNNAVNEAGGKRNASFFSHWPTNKQLCRLAFLLASIDLFTIENRPWREKFQILNFFNPTRPTRGKNRTKNKLRPWPLSWSRFEIRVNPKPYAPWTTLYLLTHVLFDWEFIFVSKTLNTMSLLTNDALVRTFASDQELLGWFNIVLCLETNVCVIIFSLFALTQHYRLPKRRRPILSKWGFWPPNTKR